jgi:hypothetical protein
MIFLVKIEEDSTKIQRLKTEGTESCIITFAIADYLEPAAVLFCSYISTYMFLFMSVGAKTVDNSLL